MPYWGLLVASGLLAATAGIGINLQNTCRDFGSAANRVKPLKTFNIVMLVLALLLFLYAISPPILFAVTGGKVRMHQA